MPIRKQDYPDNWKALSLQVRADAGQKCQWCHAPNGEWIRRHDRPTQMRQIEIAGTAKMVPELDFDVSFMALAGLVEDKEMKKEGFVKVVLSVAHLDRDRDNNDISNLAALCQRCHLNHDRHAQHIPNRRFGRYHDRDQTKLF